MNSFKPSVLDNFYYFVKLIKTKLAQILPKLIENFRNMKKLISVIAFVCFVLSSLSLFSQTQEELDAMRQDFENYKKQEEENFRKYVEEQDKAFAEFLKQDWERFELFKGDKLGRVPGPDKIPEYKPNMNVSVDKPIPTLDSRDDSTPVVTEKPPFIMERKPLTAKLPVNVVIKPDVKRKTAVFDFYGKEMSLLYDPELHQNPGTENGPNVISAYFNALSKADYFYLIENLFQTQRKLNLNDWGYLLLVENLSKKVCVTEKEQVLFQWFILLKSGYKTKLAYYDDEISLLIPTKSALYGLPYLKIDNEQYYVLNENLKQIHTYNKDYPGANRTFDIYLTQTPNLPLELAFREFNVNGQKVKVAYNLNLKAYYNDFPQSEIAVFFHSAMSPVTRESLLNYFEKAVAGKSEVEAVNIILNFVQSQFEYQTDQEQFGVEKFFFPDELFMYDAADCEDRSVLFSYLVEELLGLSVVGLDYPGHIATAVKFTSPVKGRFVEFKGDRYTICDPTFIGAPVGACMPQYENTQAVIVPLNKMQSLEEIVEPLWANIYEQGGFINNVDQIATQDANGNIYLTGSYNKKLSIQGSTLTSHRSRSGFIATFSPQGKLIKLSSLDQEEYVSPYNILVADNQIFVSGLVEKENEAQHFLSSYNQNQTNNWFKILDTNDEDRTTSGYLGYSLSNDGELITEEHVNDMSVNESEAMAVMSDGSIRLNAYLPAPNYMARVERLTPVEMAKLWKKRSVEYERNAYHESVSGVLAFFNTLESYRLIVGGKEITATLNALNPNFMVQNPDLHENLKQITKIGLDRGLMTIHTKDQEAIRLGDIIIHDGAKFRLHNYQTGNLKLAVVQGVEFKSVFRKFSVNYLKIFRANGDILIDYNKKHDQRIVSVSPDFVN